MEIVMSDTDTAGQHLEAELDALECSLIELGLRARELLAGAIATFDGDRGACDRVVAGAATLHGDSEQLEQEAFALLAAQSPAAGDLRLLIAVLRTCRHVDRIGDAAASIARLRLMSMDLPLSERILALVAKMGAEVLGMIDVALRAFSSRELTAIAPMAYTDDLVSRLHDEVFWETIADSDDARRLESALRMHQVSRHLKRAADDALEITEQITFLVAGELNIA
jgi:phosphate transport system protein